MTHAHVICLFLLTGWLSMRHEASAQDTLDRTHSPKPQPAAGLKLPSIQRAELSNGLRLWLVEDHEVPIVACNLVLRAGSECDSLTAAGTSSITAAMLQEGTPTRTSMQIAEEIGSIGASMNFSSQPDFASASLSTLTKHLDEALSVLADVVIRPTFPEKEFARVKKERLVALLQQKERATIVATRAFNRILYGEGHPYGLNSSGSAESIERMTRDDLVRFYQRYYRPNNATMIVVGDVTIDDMKSLLNKAFGQWERAEVPSPPAYTTPSVRTRAIYLIDKPGAAQSEIRIGCPALARATPDYFPVILMNTVLGGQFTSRLNANIRERRGFSYGVRSAFTFNRLPGPFVASGGVQTAKTDAALKEFLYEIDLMHSKGVTQQELEFAKNRMKGTFAISTETPSQVAAALVNILVYALPDDYLTTYVRNVEAVSLEESQRAANEYLDSSRMAIVVVGDVKEIRQGIEEMKIAPIAIADINGNVSAK